MDAAELSSHLEQKTPGNQPMQGDAEFESGSSPPVQ